jgi:dienelactone hydrolase
MARRPAPSVDRPTLSYIAHRGPHRVAVGDLASAGMPGVIYAPRSGRGLPVIGFARGWMQPVSRYTATMKYLASWGMVVVAPYTERSPLPSHAGMARDLRTAMDLVVTSKLADGVLSADSRRFGVLGHSLGGGVATLAASVDPSIRAVVTVTAADTRPSAIVAAGNVLAPGLHLVGERDAIAGGDGVEIANAWAGPVQLRTVKKVAHLGLAEGTHWTTAVLGDGKERRIQDVTRTLATAFLLRHVAGQDQLAEALEKKFSGTTLVPVPTEG